MKSSNKKVKILSLTGTTMIISGLIANFFIGFQQDKVVTASRMNDVINLYKPFTSNIEKFNQLRDDLYINVFSEIYYDNLNENILNIKEKLKEYENLTDEVIKDAKTLESYCTNVYYTKSSVNTKCNNYKINYEKTVNYFVSDIKKVNDVIEKYNNYQMQENNKLDLYKTNKKYIDYNKDRKYEGKDE